MFTEGAFMRESRKFVFIVIALIALIFGGTLGYLFLLDVSVIDALYMTIITISTVGYQEVAEMTDASKLFSIFLIFLITSFCIIANNKKYTVITIC